MIICVCNNINERKIRETLNQKPKTSKKVFDLLGEKPQCGKCKAAICQIILCEEEYEKSKIVV